MKLTSFTPPSTCNCADSPSSKLSFLCLSVKCHIFLLFPFHFVRCLRTKVIADYEWRHPGQSTSSQFSGGWFVWMLAPVGTAHPQTFESFAFLITGSYLWPKSWVQCLRFVLPSAGNWDKLCDTQDMRSTDWWNNRILQKAVTLGLCSEAKSQIQVPFFETNTAWIPSALRISKGGGLAHWLRPVLENVFLFPLCVL